MKDNTKNSISRHFFREFILAAIINSASGVILILEIETAGKVFGFFVLWPPLFFGEVYYRINKYNKSAEVEVEQREKPKLSRIILFRFTLMATFHLLIAGYFIFGPSGIADDWRVWLIVILMAWPPFFLRKIYDLIKRYERRELAW